MIVAADFNFDESEIRSRTTDKLFSLAEDLLDDGNVLELIRRGDYLYGKVDGNGFLPYKVYVKLNDGRIEWTQCSSETKLPGDSQYVVAVLLYALRFPEDIDVRLEMEKELEQLSALALRQLWMESIEQKIETFDWLELHIPLFANITDSTEVSKPEISEGREEISTPVAEELAPAKTATNLDAETVRWQVYTVLHSLDHISPEKIPARLSEVVEDVRKLMHQIVSITSAEHWETGLLLFEALIEEWSAEWNHLSSHGKEIVQFWDELDTTLAELLLSLDLPEDETDEWYGLLSDWQDEGEALNIRVFPVTSLALQEGWDDEELVQKLNGSFSRDEDTSAGAVDGQGLTVEERLVGIRLGILRQKGRMTEYLHLAEYSNASLPWVMTLIEREDYRNAVDVALRVVEQPSEAIQLARTLADKEEFTYAIELLGHMSTLDGIFQRQDLVWGLELTAQHDVEATVELGVVFFRMFPSLSTYKIIKTASGAQWGTYQAELKALLEQERYAEQAKVEILLFENKLDEAILFVESIEDEEILGRAVEAVLEQRADWALRVCKAQAEPLITQGLTEKYPLAAAWLKRGLQAAKHNQTIREYVKYLERIIFNNSRKRKLTPLLQTLLSEARGAAKKARKLARAKREERLSAKKKAKSEDLYPQFLEGLSEPAVRFLHLLDQQGNLLMSEVEEALGLESKRAVGGIVGSIKRRATKFQIQPPYETGITDGGERYWRWIGRSANTKSV